MPFVALLKLCFEPHNEPKARLELALSELARTGVVEEDAALLAELAAAQTSGPVSEALAELARTTREALDKSK